jgi:hypothetical protein
MDLRVDRDLAEKVRTLEKHAQRNNYGEFATIRPLTFANGASDVRVICVAGDSPCNHN